MSEMKTLNGFEIVDAKAREDISALQEAVENAGGGSSYTFTNGLTETDGTVSWDLNDHVIKGNNRNLALGRLNANSVNLNNGYGAVVIGRFDGSGTAVAGSHGSMCLGFASYGSMYANGAGSLAIGQAAEYGGTLYSSGGGSLAGGYAYNKRLESTENGSFAFGYAHSTYGDIKSRSYGSASFGCGTQGVSSRPGQFILGVSNDTTNISDKLFVIGNGTKDSARSNALTVDTSGNVVAAGTVSPTGADYAEYFEFEDGNPTKEDRVGYLVALSGAKISLANGTDILGAISGTMGVIGDAEEMNWHGKYERDEFGRHVYEDYDIVHEEGSENEWVEHVHAKKISKDYDPTKTYIPRSKRPEWAPVGLLGKVLVRHDGTVSAGDYVKAINGIASKSDERTNIRVLEVISDNVIKVLIK